MATGLIERIAEAGHQARLVDPEGDYETLDDVVALGSTARAPDADEVISVLEPPYCSVAANLTGLALAERPAFFVSLATRLLDLRTRTGRPHWLIVDEAHHVLGRLARARAGGAGARRGCDPHHGGADPRGAGHRREGGRADCPRAASRRDPPGNMRLPWAEPPPSWPPS